MSLHPFYNFLKKLPKEKLPGRQAQIKMSPEPLDPNVVLPKEKSDTAQPSSVLVPLFPGQNQKLHVILTLRTDNIRHAGQISFPGGQNEKNESLEETALRETEEEIGVKRSQIKLACSITPLYLYKTDNQITPFVGFLDKKPKLTPNPEEVEEAFAISMDDLLDEKTLKKEKWDLPHISMMVPYWDIHRVPLWGATAMMMSELVELYREFLKG